MSNLSMQIDYFIQGMVSKVEVYAPWGQLFNPH